MRRLRGAVVVDDDACPRVLRSGAYAVPAGRERRPRPGEELLCVVRRHVHAPVAPLVSEGRVPEGAVERVAAVEVHDPRHVLDRVRTVARAVVVHRRRDVLLADAEAAHARAVVLRRIVVIVATARDQRRVDRLVPLESDERLRAQVDVDPLLAGRQVGRRRARLGDGPIEVAHPPAVHRLVVYALLEEPLLAGEPDDLEAVDVRPSLQLRLCVGAREPVLARVEPEDEADRELAPFVGVPDVHPLELGLRLVQQHVLVRHVQPGGGLPELTGREADELVEREIEATNQARRDGPLLRVEVVQADLLARPLLQVPGRVASRPLVRLAVGLWVRLSDRQAALILGSFVERRFLLVQGSPGGEIERVLVRERAIRERRMRRVRELGGVHVARDGLAAHEAASDELVPPALAVRLLEDLRLRENDVPLPEIPEANDPHALVRRFRRVVGRPLRATRDGRRRLDGSYTNRRRGTAVRRRGPQLDDVTGLRHGVGRRGGVGWRPRRRVLAGAREKAEQDGCDRDGERAAEAGHRPQPGVRHDS